MFLRTQAVKAQSANAAMMRVMIVVIIINNLNQQVLKQIIELFSNLFKFYTENMQKTSTTTLINNTNTLNYHSQQYPTPSRTNLIQQNLQRPTSPNSKTKIRLVSPLRQKGCIQKKENYPPFIPNSLQSPSNKGVMQIQLGGKTNQNYQSKQFYNIQTPTQITKQAVKPFPLPNFKKNPSKVQIQGNFPPAEPQRCASPTKIVINNKCFDLSALKSKIVLVTPLKSKEDIKSQQMNDSIRKSGSPEQLIIQQENTLQDLKESYESQMKEIKQLQQQIQDNNLQIKQLLRCSNVSRNLASSRHSTHNNANTQPNFYRAQKTTSYHQNTPQSQTSPKSLIKIISKLQQQSQAILHPHKKEHEKDEVSVQTDFAQYYEQQPSRNDSRFLKWAITKNKECQIKLISTRQDESNIFATQKDHQYTLVNDIKRQSEYAIQLNTDQHVQFQQEPIQQIIPVSQRSIQSVHNSRVSVQNQPILNLKASRADSQRSIIRQTQQKLQSQYEIQPMKNESMVSLKEDQLNRSKMDVTNRYIQTPQKQIQKIVNKVPSSTMLESTKGINIGSGKRRINNSIYL